MDIEKNGEALILCRCEEVTEEEVLQAIREGCRTLDEVKRYTRAGMGLCQGRTCGKLIAAMIHKHTGIPIERILPITTRFPVKPVMLKVLSGLHGDE
ncbi:MAG: (2Fe-2S)-binding protein [Spirochaetaceae bacterium]|nr:MAG: (2Fe-2S)-binding protein [Spirochaetaceae bacterium]